MLLIDDQIKFSRLLKETLEFFDFEVELFNSSVLALEYSKNNKPDIVICEIYMPKMNGYDFLSEFKKLGYWDVPFIFLTSKNIEEDLRKGMNLGADDYLVKPIKPKTLIEAIRTQLEKKEHFVDEFRKMEMNLKYEIDKKDATLQKEAAMLSYVVRFPLATLMRVVRIIENPNIKKDKTKLINSLRPIAEELDKTIRENVSFINNAVLQ